MKKTEWFPADVKPVHEGWYDTYKKFPVLAKKRFWNAENESWGASWEHFNQRWNWRGLAEKPE